MVDKHIANQYPKEIKKALNCGEDSVYNILEWPLTNLGAPIPSNIFKFLDRQSPEWNSMYFLLLFSSISHGE